MISLVWMSLTLGWLSPGERAKKDEFWQAWQQRFGPVQPGNPSTVPPEMTLKAWYKAWKRTQISAVQWLQANTPGPASGRIV